MDERISRVLEYLEKTYPPKKSGPSIKRLVDVFKTEDQRVMLGFGPGKFDDWCIYVISQDKKWMKFPTDEWYFGIVKSWTAFRAPELIYADFVKIYDATTADANLPATRKVIEIIRGLTFNYKDDFEALVIFTILYMGMIAEENKAGAVLKKRIKRLGMHQVLIEGLPVEEAAHFSRGRSTFELAPYCLERGF